MPTGEEGDNSDNDMDVDPSPSEEDIIKVGTENSDFTNCRTFSSFLNYII